jgi:hypothetical protein
MRENTLRFKSKTGCDADDDILKNESVMDPYCDLGLDEDLAYITKIKESNYDDDLNDYLCDSRFFD